METEPEKQSNSLNTQPRKKRYIWLWLVSILFIFIWGIYFSFVTLSKPPSGFPTNVPVIIPEGASAKKTTQILSEGGYVRSEFVLYVSLLLWHDPSTIKASTYIFANPLNTREIANEITQGRFSDDLIKFTHIEGERVDILAKRAAQILPDFDEDKFITLAVSLEGKLFPETYLIPKNYTAEELLDLMLDTFNLQIKPLEEQISESELTLSEIITLASIIEREANSIESKRMVSGILQKRLSINMPLQADASIEYILNKSLKELTADDLKIDSPYNTYLNTGLPPTPIGNPGLESIMAVLEPTPSNYLFYITGNDGEFYYASDFEGHKLNIAKHLR